MAQEHSAASVSALVKSFGRTQALRGTTFEVPNGSVVGLIGPNGAGKTTVMRILLDLVRPGRGTATVLGEPSRNAGSETRKRIGYLPGDLRLEGRITGRRLLEQFAEISGPTKRGAADALAERLQVDLSARVRSLSKGNRQKLGIIQAFQHTPALLVLDEPTSGLDPLMQREFLGLVREARDAGATILLSSHQISEIQQAADRVVLLRRGVVAATSTVAELREAAPRRVVVRADGVDADELRLRLGASLADATFETGRAAGILHGPVAALVASVDAVPVTDLVIEEPDLEQVVLTHYADEEGE